MKSNMQKAWLLVCFCFLSALYTSAQKQPIVYAPVKAFIQNQGQFNEFAGKNLPQTAKYAFIGDGESYFFYPGGFSIQLVKRSLVKKNDEETERERERESKRPDISKGLKEHEEEEEKRMVESSEWLHYSFENANSNHSLIVHSAQSATHSFMVRDHQSNKYKSLNNLPGFDTLLYQNIYPGIDAIITFHPDHGLEYSFRLSANSDMSAIALKCNRKSRLDANGNRIISTIFGDVIEHPAKAWYADDRQVINLSASGDKFSRSFSAEQLQSGRELIIDPWIQTPSFNTNWDCVWECERDGAGNVYIIGGVMPMQLLKYNAAGALQWTYNTPYDTASVWLGSFATDLAGNSYVTSGTAVAIQKINTGGALVWNNPNPGGLFSLTEFWSIAFNCDQSKMLVGGTGGVINPEPYVYDVDMNNGNVISSVQVTGPGALIGIPPNTNEVRSIVATERSNYYFLTHDSIGYISDDLGLCPNTTGPFHVANDNYNLSYKCENWRYDNSSIEALAYFGDFVFVNRGTRLDKIEVTTAQVVQSVTIPGGGFPSTFGQNTVQNSGIDIDGCGTIFVGSKNGVYAFNQNLVQVGNYPVGFNVYDIAVNTNGEVIAAGSTGTSNDNSRSGFVQAIAAGACSPAAASCCDIAVCPPPALCITDAPVQLAANSGGGTWAGTGVNASGIFDPAATGPGSFVVTYTQPCGTESLVVVVNSCSAMSVCLDSTGTLNVVGGDAPYTWSYFQPATSTPITNQAQCVACGYTWFFGSCLNGIFPANSCNTPAGYVTWSNGTSAPPPPLFPAQVVDNAGTIVTIDSLGGLPPCALCPASLASVQSIVDPLCNGGTGSASLTTDPTVTSVNWQPGSFSGASQAALPAGTYQISISATGGCSDSLSLTINEPSALVLDSVQTIPAACSGTSGSASLQFSGGTGPYSTNWFSGSTNIQSQSNLNAADTLNNLSAGSYSVVVTDANGCSSQQTFSISNTGGPSISVLNINPVVCFGDSSGSGSSTVSGGTAPFTFLWTDALGNIVLNQPGSSGSSTVNGLAAGNYQISVTDAAGCVTIQSFTVNQPASALGLSQVTINPATCGNANGSIVVTPSGGTPAYNFVWTPTGGTDSLTQNILAGIYVLVLTDANACAFDTTITVNNSDGPQVQLGSLTQPSCFGGNNGSASVQVSGGTPPYNYAWTGTSAGNSPSANNLSAGNYVVTVTDASGCTQSFPLAMTQPPSMAYTSSSVGATCGNANGIATIIASGGNDPYSYQWSNGVTGATTISQIPSGLYSAVITDSSGCVILATVNVGGSAGPVVNAGEDVLIQEGQSVNLDATIPGASNYTWIPPNGLSCINCPDPVASPDTTTLYIVSVTYNGCLGSDSVLISVETKCGDIFIPSAFSPNGDGNNDKLYLRGICIQSMLFKVYDRWGRVLFETSDPALGWDGTFEGKPCVAGVYTYTAEVTVKGSVLSSKGNVTLQR